LGYPNLAASRSRPFFDNLAATNKLAENIFAIYLSDSPDEKGSIMFGGYNPQYAHSEIKYYPISKKGYWEIELSSIKVGNAEIMICDYLKSKGGHCGAVIDTGTSVIAGPTEIINSMTSLLNYNEDCDKIENLPNITFVIHGDEYVFEPHEYVVRLNDRQTKPKKGSKSKGICVPGLMGMDVPPPKGPVVILGAIFLHKYYTIFDRQQNRIGFSLAHSPDENPNKKIISVANIVDDDDIAKLAREIETQTKKKDDDDDWKVVYDGTSKSQGKSKKFLAL